MALPGEFKYVEGWFAVFFEDGLIVREGPFDTEEEAKAERIARTEDPNAKNRK